MLNAKSISISDPALSSISGVYILSLFEKMGIADVMKPPVTAGGATPALELIRPLSNGVTHAVAIVDDQLRLLGIITQTDLLAAMSRGLTRNIDQSIAA